MKSKTIKLQGVGDILLERSLRAKHLCLSIRPFKRPRVAVPRGVSFQSAGAFALSKARWIKSHMERITELEQRAADLRENHPFNPGKARRQLIRRLEFLAQKHGFAYNKVFVRNQKTRWGSCSHQNNINLNIHLTQLPSELIDYTLLHELLHTRIKHHGPRFWSELNRYITNARKLDRQLDQYRGLLSR